MAPLSSVPERLRSLDESYRGSRFRAKRAPLRWAACRAWRFVRTAHRLLPLSRVRKPSVKCQFSTRSVLLPESLWVCPFGGVAAHLRSRLPTRSPDACAKFTRRRIGCQIAPHLSNCANAESLQPIIGLTSRFSRGMPPIRHMSARFPALCFDSAFISSMKEQRNGLESLCGKHSSDAGNATYRGGPKGCGTRQTRSSRAEPATRIWRTRRCAGEGGLLGTSSSHLRAVGTAAVGYQGALPRGAPTHFGSAQRGVSVREVVWRPSGHSRALSAHEWPCC